MFCGFIRRTTQVGHLLQQANCAFHSKSNLNIMTLITTKFKEIHMSHFRKVALERLVQTDSIFQLPLYSVKK